MTTTLSPSGISPECMCDDSPGACHLPDCPDYISEECPRCANHGLVHVTGSWENDESPDADTRTCPDCDGRGWV